MPLRSTVEKIKKEAALVMGPRDERMVQLGADVCPICGKTFFSTAEWAYMRVVWLRGSHHRLPVCSWHCYRAAEGLVPLAKKRW